MFPSLIVCLSRLLPFRSLSLSHLSFFPSFVLNISLSPPSSPSLEGIAIMQGIAELEPLILTAMFWPERPNLAAPDKVMLFACILCGVDIHMYMRTYMYTCTPTWIHPCMIYKYIYVLIRIHTKTYTYTRTLKHIQTHTHTCTHAHSSE